MQTKLPAGEQVAGYRIESFIARGGMAEVYCARDLQLHRQVALKLLAPELAENENFRARFLRESRLAASMDHPHIIPIYSAGMADDVLYLAMRYVQGSDLKALLAREGPLSLDRARLLLGQVGQALDAAHERGLVHRDVKPANVLVGGSGAAGAEHVYLSDFGLTKRSSSMSGLTAAGFVAGTIDYIAPEQITAKPVDPQMDMYALGCVLYEVLTGQVPYPRDHDAAVLYAHMFDPPPAVTALRPDLPASVDAVVATAMAKDGRDRYPSCRELFADLEAVGPAVPHARSAEHPAPTHVPARGYGTPREASAPGAGWQPSAGDWSGSEAPGVDALPPPAAAEPDLAPATEPPAGAPPAADPAAAPAPAPAEPRQLLGCDANAVPAARPQASRRGLVPLVAAMVVVAGAVLGVLAWRLLDPEPALLRTTEEIDGLRIERSWELGGRNGDRLQAELVVTPLASAGGGGPGTVLVEVLPRSMVTDSRLVDRGRLDLEFHTSRVLVLRTLVQAGGPTTFTYSVEVPDGPRDAARLQAWSREQQEARAGLAGRQVGLGPSADQ